MSEAPALETLLQLAGALVDAVALDNNGMMVGTQWQGGHGGLYTPATIAHADALRRQIAALRAQPEDPAAAAALRARARDNQL